MRILNLVFLLIIMLFTGCATKYQPLAYTGGYSDSKVSENMFNVYFYGNGRVTFEKSSDFALLRSAELTKNNNFLYFVILNSNSKSHYDFFVTADQGMKNINVNSIEKPRTEYKIKCFKEISKEYEVVYNAEFIIKSIKEKYEIKE